MCSLRLPLRIVFHETTEVQGDVALKHSVNRDGVTYFQYVHQVAKW